VGRGKWILWYNGQCLLHCTSLLSSVVISRPRSQDSRALHFILLRTWSQSQDLDTKVSFTAACDLVCAKYNKHLALLKLHKKCTKTISRLVGLESMDVDNSLNSWLFQKSVLHHWFQTSMRFFPTILCNYCCKCQGFSLGLRTLTPRSHSWSRVFKKVLTTTLILSALCFK